MNKTKCDAILISEDDNVVTVIHSIKKGEAVSYLRGNKMESILAITNIPAFHKIAVTNVKSGSHVCKYNEVIGIATCDIAAGEHVHTQNITSA